MLVGSSNQVCDESSAIAAGTSNVIGGEVTPATDAWIGSGGYNLISNADGSAIGAGYDNTISGSAGVIGGGRSNAASAEYSVIGGGDANTIPATTAEDATIGGGAANSVTAEWGTVAGGKSNTASGNASNVAGGANNTASGEHATVLGGSKNTASGNQSLAAGVDSNAATAGSFVWSDDSSGATQLTSRVDDEFLARASGGFKLWTNATNTVGATLASGSGTWASASDRAMKTNVARIDDAEVLDKVATLPISTWSYVSERGVRHVGPMAQDFYAAFGVGEDDRHITSIDEDGVALAAIKALHAENARLVAKQRDGAVQRAQFRAEIRAQQREIDELRAIVRSIVRR